MIESCSVESWWSYSTKSCFYIGTKSTVFLVYKMIIKINTPLSLHTQIRQALEQTFFNVGYLLSSTAITQRRSLSVHSTIC